jgi:SPX domain protein involved in polyphosphate accumulation
MIEPARDSSSTTSQRVEQKYPLVEEMLDDAIAHLSELLPIRRYNDQDVWSSLRTTYLDTPDRRCYQEYIRDLPVRHKVRIRQYGVNGHLDEVCWVELKVKHRNLGIKRRFACGVGDATRLIAGEDVLDGVLRHNEDDVTPIYRMIRSMIVEGRLEPVVRVDYRRLSFQRADDPHMRLTLDRGLSFHSPSLEHRGELDGLVLEVKHNGVKPAWLPALRETLALKRARRFSKFARSMDKLDKLQCEVHP